MCASVYTVTLSCTLLFSTLHLSPPHCRDVPQNQAVNWLLDTLAFTPQWTADTLQRLEKAKKEGDALVLHSEQDAVSDCRDLEKYLSHSWSKGKHARLFHPEAGNDFGVVEQFLKRYTP